VPGLRVANVTGRTDAPNRSAGGAKGQEPFPPSDDTFTVCHFPWCRRHDQPALELPAWMGRHFDAWATSPQFAESYQTFLNIQVEAESHQQEQFAAEATKTGRYVATLPLVAPDGVATVLVRDMLRYEDEGRVVWTGKTWRKKIRRLTVRDFIALSADELLSRFDMVTRTSSGYRARCPAHDDRTPSLTIRRGDRWWLLHCFAQCGTADVCAAVGLAVADLALGGTDG